MLYHSPIRAAKSQWRVQSRLLSLAAIALVASSASGQVATSLDALVARADSANPSIQAARDRVTAAAARVWPASAWVDPMLMAGIQNLLGSENATVAGGHASAATIPGDPMTMKMIGISQTIPYSGKLSLRREAAEREVDAAKAELDAARLAVSHQGRIT